MVAYDGHLYPTQSNGHILLWDGSVAWKIYMILVEFGDSGQRWLRSEVPWSSQFLQDGPSAQV